jgi:hypothetical protein
MTCGNKINAEQSSDEVREMYKIYITVLHVWLI